MNAYLAGSDPAGRFGRPPGRLKLRADLGELAGVGFARGVESFASQAPARRPRVLDGVVLGDRERRQLRPQPIELRVALGERRVEGRRRLGGLRLGGRGRRRREQLKEALRAAGEVVEVPRPVKVGRPGVRVRAVAPLVPGAGDDHRPGQVLEVRVGRPLHVGHGLGELGLRAVRRLGQVGGVVARDLQGLLLGVGVPVPEGAG